MNTALPAIEVKLMVHKDQRLRTISVPRDSSVAEMKNLLHAEHGLERCEILFCGHAMDDESRLDNYDIGSQTTLHVVSLRHAPQHRSGKSPGKKQSCAKIAYLTGIWLHRQNSPSPFYLASASAGVRECGQGLGARHPQFYVYCKSRCTAVHRGRLRVRCSSCKDDSIVLHRDPREWDDVLKSGQILGDCLSAKCDGSVCDAEFYFKCTSCRNNPETTVPLPSVTTNVNETACATCIDVENPVIAFPCNNGHVMCLPCVEQYARSKLQERGMIFEKTVGYSIQCPEGCEGSFLSDTHIFHILGIDEYRTYQAFAAEECLIHGMKGMICPNLDCGSGIYPDLACDFEEKAKITCPTCGHKFCSTCREAYHGSSECGSELPSRSGGSVLVRDYFATMKTIAEISKKCPRCGVPTERNGGCMHMACKMCQYEWCWNCIKEWNRNCQANHWFT